MITVPACVSIFGPTTAAFVIAATASGSGTGGRGATGITVGFRFASGGDELMSQVDRFSVSLDTELLAAFDRHIADRGYQNRSEAIRDMIRDLLVTSRLQQGAEPVAALLTLVCDHCEGEASKRLRACLAAHADVVRGSLHLPIDEHRDGLAIGLKGPADRVQAVANQIQAMRGVTHGHLSAVPIEECRSSRG